MIKEKYNLPDEYLLFVGVLALKKNLATLIKAFGWLQEQGEKFPPLLIIGPKYKLSDASTIFALIRSLNLTQRVHYLGPVLTSELMWIYRHAKIFLFPSIHEGFGIPCLKPACQTPVLASRASAIPEVIGEAGCLVADYMSPQAWAKSISKLLSDQELRSALVQKGLVQVQKFSWTTSAEKLATLYTQLLDLE
jgi:glycosyltransferase involved in cell wall biosynthesis